MKTKILIFCVFALTLLISHIASAQPDFSTKTDFVTATNPSSIAIADFNGDGKPDVVTGNSGSLSASVFLNTTTTGSLTPTFTAKTDFSTGGSAFCVATGYINCD